MDKALRVLFVEDHEDAREVAEILLRSFGYDVRTAADGVAALEIMREFQPEVVVLDIGLPGMDGYEVARRVREDPGLTGSVLVALTGYGDLSDRQRAHEAGFDHHLVKPTDFTTTLRELLQTVEESRAE